MDVSMERYNHIYLVLSEEEFSILNSILEEFRDAEEELPSFQMFAAELLPGLGLPPKDTNK
jgi:hypothetical protein